MKRNLLCLIALLTIPIGVLAKTQTAIFAGGCFWCVQADFDKLSGVQKTEVGYDGGTGANPSYKSVSAGKTNYVESARIYYDDEKISYRQLLVYYFTHIDPTVSDRQFCDVGKQYRSVIFYQNATQKAQAKVMLAKVRELHQRLYTELLPSTTFYRAEEYHQRYYQKNPRRYQFYRWNCGRDARVKAVWHNKVLQ